MLKRYISENRLQWVGKAWEIRYALRQAQKQNGGEARLADLLPTARQPASSRVRKKA